MTAFSIDSFPSWRWLALVLALGCPSSGPPKIDRVVLISIDTVRADALGCYGNPADTTPNIDRLAAAGTRFEVCIAPAPITFPSHATMLTGLHPLAHGLLTNAQGRLPDDIESLAEKLQAAGWRTGAVVSSSILHHRYGLAQGFESYRDDFFSDMADVDENLERTDATKTTNQALRWLEQGGDGRPEFLFLHYIDPHSPYSPPAHLNRLFPGRPYLGEIAFVDEQVGRLIAFVRSEFGDERTLWIVTSDHGEALGEHGEKTHGVLLYDEIVRVPLILSGPGVARGKVVTQPVGLIDLTPTILALLGEEPDPSLPGRPVTEPPTEGRSFVSTSYIPSFVFGWSPIWSLSQENEKYILSSDSEYYRTDTDPDEAQNLIESDPSRSHELETRLRAKAGTYMAHSQASPTVGVDEQSALELAALGYVAPNEAMLDKALDDFSGENPRHRLDTVDRMSDFTQALQAGELESAELILLELRDQDPTGSTYDSPYATLLLTMERYEELVAWMSERSEAFRNQPPSRLARARALRELKRYDEALTLLRENLAENEAASSSRYEIAIILSLKGRRDEAIAEYERLLEIDPWNSSGQINYANLLSRRGDVEEAIAVLSELIRQKPDHANAHNNIGMFYAKAGKRSDAIHHLLRAQGLEKDPARLNQIEKYLTILWRQKPAKDGSS